MGRRLKLQEKLEDILGSKSVYWQPPENIKMSYPCIVYEEHPSDPTKADNLDYLDPEVWDVTVIRTFKDRDKTSEIPKAVKNGFIYCRRGSHFIADNLIHDQFTITY